MEIHENLMILTGHSRGLGAALAHRALQNGFRVVGLSRGTLDVKHPELIQIPLDLASGDALAAALRGLEDQDLFKAVQRAYIVNNAGLLGPVQRVGSQFADEIAQAVTVNVQSLLVLTNWFAQHTQGVQDRRVCQISSGAARSAYVGWSVYCATKAAVDHHARALALEAQTPGPAQGLRVCSLAPGVIDTDMQTQVRASALDEFPNRPRFEALKESGGLASPTDVAERLWEYLGSEDFGKEPIADLRSLNR